jgi:hypothetical protein
MLALLLGLLLSLLSNLVPAFEIFWEPVDRFLGIITR